MIGLGGGCKTFSGSLTVVEEASCCLAIFSISYRTCCSTLRLISASKSIIGAGYDGGGATTAGIGFTSYTFTSSTTGFGCGITCGPIPINLIGEPPVKVFGGLG